MMAAPAAQGQRAERGDGHDAGGGLQFPRLRPGDPHRRVSRETSPAADKRTFRTQEKGCDGDGRAYVVLISVGPNSRRWRLDRWLRRCSGSELRCRGRQERSKGPAQGEPVPNAWRAFQRVSSSRSAPAGRSRPLRRRWSAALMTIAPGSQITAAATAMVTVISTKPDNSATGPTRRGSAQARATCKFNARKHSKGAFWRKRKPHIKPAIARPMQTAARPVTCVLFQYRRRASDPYRILMRRGDIVALVTWSQRSSTAAVAGVFLVLR